MQKRTGQTYYKCPWAKRVHGVKGFDAAHNKAGEIAEKHRLVTAEVTTEYTKILNKLLKLMKMNKRFYF